MDNTLATRFYLNRTPKAWQPAEIVAAKQFFRWGINRGEIRGKLVREGENAIFVFLNDNKPSQQYLNHLRCLCDSFENNLEENKNLLSLKMYLPKENKFH